MIKGIAIAVAMAASNLAWADAPPASVPYTPSWQARHYLQQLSDDAGLAITTTHWPLPGAAVESALAALPVDLPVEMALARDYVRAEMARLQRGQLVAQVRSRGEAAGGYGQNYTPGSSVGLTSAAAQGSGEGVSAAAQFGAKAEASPNSLQTQFSGLGKEGSTQVRLDNAAAVLQWGGVNFQAFAHQNWWGAGWQSSLINGHNSPPWMGVGLQRSSVQRSDSPWLSWLGPWTLEGFVARAQDPVVVANQPEGYLYTGMRLTFKPMPWAEVGLSRAVQFGGKGRPGDFNSYVKSLLGQQTNKDPGDTFQDSSNQIAGYDLRLRCPSSRSCAAYFQFMGEDSAGKYPPLPYRFTTLAGFESWFEQGRYRAFAEFMDTNVPHPFGIPGTEPAYLNAYYPQGYTNGARWIGSSMGGGSKVMTVGYMDAQMQRQLKLHAGKVGLGLGAYAPGSDAPRGDLLAVSASQAFRWKSFTLTPEIDWLHLSEGSDQRANKTHQFRLGLALSMPL
ncbi:MAG: hypothetical protein RJA36_1752 [Pseudomonadota bacterium]|jgi:hypothetical protein